MILNFAENSVAEGKLDELLEKDRNISFELELEENKVEKLSNALNLLVGRASFVKNVKILNKSEERKRFKKSRKNGENFKPDFKFKEYPYNQKTFYKLIELLKKESKSLREKDIAEYNFKHVEVDDISKLFVETFEEIEKYVSLASNIEDKQKWKNNSLEIWPMVEKETIEHSKEKLEELKDIKDAYSDSKTLKASQVKEMWEEELERIDIDYDVEVRPVGGCFNIPEERTVVVASGSEEERLYSMDEAQLLTMHELFHVVRAHNGFNAGKENNFPPVLGLHTPFYDKTEEGGAIYREHETNVITPAKEFDYHLRLLAAYYHFKEFTFEEIVEKLIGLGGSVDRSFYLAARNREALRHHIYQGGYYEHWKDREELWPLLVGKVNPEYAEIFRKEVEDGALKMPDVGSEKLFNFSFD